MLHESVLSDLLTLRKHSQKKRYIAGQYANTNIMRPQVVGGIQERADAFVKKCVEAQGASMDAYVSLDQVEIRAWFDSFRSICTVLRWIALLIICFTHTAHIRSMTKKISR